jgi:hypothetical protein
MLPYADKISNIVRGSKIINGRKIKPLDLEEKEFDI